MVPVVVYFDACIGKTRLWVSWGWKAVRPHLRNWALNVQQGNLEAASQALKDGKVAADHVKATYRAPQDNPPSKN